MAMVLLVADAPAAAVLDATVAVHLAQLGVTRVALLGDGATSGILLEGWAFRAGRTSDAVAVLFPAGARGVRVLHEQAAMAVAPSERSERWTRLQSDASGG